MKLWGFCVDFNQNIVDTSHLKKVADGVPLDPQLHTYTWMISGNFTG